MSLLRRLRCVFGRHTYLRGSPRCLECGKPRDHAEVLTRGVTEMAEAKIEPSEPMANDALDLQPPTVFIGNDPAEAVAKALANAKAQVDAANANEA